MEKKGGRSSIIDQYWVEMVSHTPIFILGYYICMYICMHAHTCMHTLVMCDIDHNRDVLYQNIKPLISQHDTYHDTLYNLSRYTYASATLACDLQCKKLSNKICYETITFITCNVLIIQLIWQLNT